MKDEKETTEEKEGLTPLELKFMTAYLQGVDDWAKSSSNNTKDISIYVGKAAARVCEEEMRKLLPSQNEIDKAVDDYGFVVPYDGSHKFYDEIKMKHFSAGVKFVTDYLKQKGINP